MYRQEDHERGGSLVYLCSYYVSKSCE